MVEPATESDGVPAAGEDPARRLAEVAAAIPGPEDAQRLAETFRVLSDPGRVRLILALLSAGELRVGELATVTGLSETACSTASGCCGPSGSSASARTAAASTTRSTTITSARCSTSPASTSCTRGPATELAAVGRAAPAAVDPGRRRHDPGAVRRPVGPGVGQEAERGPEGLMSGR